jgi:dipeptidyl aminopeptidase/acylaminoacyl peptidase
MVAAGGLRINDLQCDGDDVYWIEGRPVERGRCEVVRYRDGRMEDVLGAPFSARNSVHEYGGGALLALGGTVYFSNAPDRRLYSVAPGARPQPLTANVGGLRYADFVLDAPRNRLIAVVEDHNQRPARNDIRAISIRDGTLTSLTGGYDFYAYPRLSPDGNQLAWLCWNQPNMPWDGNELWLAGVDESGGLVDSRQIAGGAKESIFQPAWSPDGVLHYCSDRSGWWNLYRRDGERDVALAPMDAECGKPMFVLRQATYAFCGDGRIALTACRNGIWELGYVDAQPGHVTWLDLPYTATGYIDARGDTVVLTAGGPRDPLSVVRVELSSGTHRVLRRGTDVVVDESVLSVPQAISLPGHEGATTHAFLYPPRNDAVAADPSSLPPLLVYAHGGPTSAASTALNLEVQFWTSRGFTYLDVNYGGSTGYGRAYRDRLYGNLGVVDVGDCVAAARHLAQQKEVDPERLSIQGGSAGGYIVLCAMTFHDVFDVGASYFGIADWEAFDADTHKFEARYNDFLIGPYPERRDLYYARSPVHFIDRVRGAVILFQGLDDPVVPPNQSEMMFEALRARGVPCAYIAYPGEQHGFRQAANIQRSLEAQLYFFSRILGFELADPVESVEIVNLDSAAVRP